MQIHVDFRSGIPIYVQIIDQIKNQLTAGILKPDDQLPTVRQLASDLRVNFNTVARAYRLLDEAGLISTQHGRGTYILAPPHEAAAETLKRQSLEGLARNFLKHAQRLGVSPGEVRETLDALIERWEHEGAPPEEGHL